MHLFSTKKTDSISKNHFLFQWFVNIVQFPTRRCDLMYEFNLENRTESSNLQREFHWPELGLEAHQKTLATGNRSDVDM